MNEGIGRGPPNDIDRHDSAPVRLRPFHHRSGALQSRDASLEHLRTRIWNEPMAIGHLDPRERLGIEHHRTAASLGVEAIGLEFVVTTQPREPPALLCSSISEPP